MKSFGRRTGRLPIATNRVAVEYARGDGKEDSQLLIEVARHLDRFIARLFHIEKEVHD